VTVIDETIEALSRLDHERLLSLEVRIQSLARGSALTMIAPSLLAKREALQCLLTETRDTLTVLERLHGADKGDTWER
jgi:hypothetical protein